MKPPLSYGFPVNFPFSSGFPMVFVHQYGDGQRRLARGWPNLPVPQSTSAAKAPRRSSATQPLSHGEGKIWSVDRWVEGKIEPETRGIFPWRSWDFPVMVLNHSKPIHWVDGKLTLFTMENQVVRWNIIYKSPINYYKLLTPRCHYGKSCVNETSSINHQKTNITMENHHV